MQLIVAWALNDRELPDGRSVARQYAEREDLREGERDIAARIAAARLGVLRVVRVMSGRWIELDDLTSGDTVRAISHDVSRAVRTHDLLVARLMDGPPATSLWGAVGILTRETGRELMDLLRARTELSQVGGLATAMHAASRDVTVLLAPALRSARATPRAA